MELYEVIEKIIREALEGGTEIPRVVILNKETGEYDYIKSTIPIYVKEPYKIVAIFNSPALMDIKDSILICSESSDIEDCIESEVDFLYQQLKEEV